MPNRDTMLLAFLMVTLCMIQGGEASRADEGEERVLQGWDTAVVAPMATIEMPGVDHTDSEAKEMVDRFLKVLEERGIKARKATLTDQRFLTLSMKVMAGPESPFLIRLQHREPARFSRDGEEVTGIATTWETEVDANYHREHSTPWPVIEKTMKALCDDLSAAIQGTPTNPAGGQARRTKSQVNEGGA